MFSKIFTVLWFVLLAFIPVASGMGDDRHDHQHGTVIAEKIISTSGTVKSIADNHDSLRIFHDPIPALKWPSMNMPFEVIDHELTHPLNVGDRVNFEFVQKEGKNIIIKMSK